MSERKQSISYFSKFIEEDKAKKNKAKTENDEQEENELVSDVRSHGDASDLFDFDSRFNTVDGKMKKMKNEVKILADDALKIQEIIASYFSRIESNQRNEYSSSEPIQQTPLEMKDPESFCDDPENRAKNDDLSSPLIVSSDAVTIKSEALLLNVSYFIFVSSIILWLFSFERSIALNRTILESLSVITYMILAIGVYHTIRCIKNQSPVDPVLGSILPYFLVPVGYSIKMIKLNVDHKDGDWMYIENTSWVTVWSIAGAFNIFMVIRYNQERRKNMKTFPKYKAMDLENHRHPISSYSESKII